MTIDYSPLQQDSDREIMVSAMEVEHKNVFHLKNLYIRIYQWLLEYGYEETQVPGGDVFENMYIQRQLPNGMLEYFVWWRAQKKPANSAFFNYFLTFSFRGLGYKKKDIIVEGKKQGSDDGDIILRIEAYLISDYANQMKKHWFMKHWHRRYRKRWFRKEVETHKDELYKEVYKLHTAAKEYLKLTLPRDQPEPYWTKMGV